MVSDSLYLLAIGGKAYTIITSEGGDAITLATSGAGVVTSKFGSIYTVATAAVASATSKHSAATPSTSMQAPLLIGIVTVMISTIIGAYITI
jgi:hypothetical protein